MTEQEAIERLRAAWNRRRARPPVTASAPASNPVRPEGLPGVVTLCVQQVRAVLAENERNVRRQSRLCSVLELARDPYAQSARPNDGARRWALLQRTLDSLNTNGGKRSLDQTRFHEAMLISCASLVMGRENFLAEREGLLAQLGRADFPFGTLILCPRRWGKSTSVAMFCASILYVCPRVRLLVMATQRKSSGLLMKATLYYYTQLPGGSARVLENNSFRVLVRSSDYVGSRAEALRLGAVSGITACAPTENSIRGESANLILIDEAAFVPLSVISVLAPLLMVEQTALICISTPDGVENWYSKLFQPPRDAEDDPVGDMFLRFHVDLLCQACRRAGRARGCDHNAHLLPAWIDQTGQRRADVLIRSDEHYAQELMGSIVTTGGGLLPAATVSRALAPLLQPELALQRVCERRQAVGDFAPPQQLERLAAARDLALAAVAAAGEKLSFALRPEVYVFIDPAGGGRSETGAVALVPHPRERSKLVVVGLCSIAASPAGDELDQWLPLFLQRLGGLPVLSEARFWVGIESNFGGQHLVRLLLEKYVAPNLPYWTEWREPTTGGGGGGSALPTPAKHGLCTTRHAQVVGAHLLRDLLHRHGLYFAQGVVCVGRPSRLEILKLLEQQLLQLAEVRGGITGKTASQNDDLVMSIVLALYWARVSHG